MNRAIQGSKVALRALAAGDLPLLRGFVNDPEVMQHSNTYQPVHDIAQARWFESMASSPHAIWFGLADLQREGQPLVGTCCLVDIDRVARQAELRIRIGDVSAWGGGLGSEACALLLRYGFDEQNLERIWLRVFARNERAIRMYQRLGFREEGRLRRAAFIRGEYDDVIMMGLLRAERVPEKTV